MIPPFFFFFSYFRISSQVLLKLILWLFKNYRIFKNLKFFFFFLLKFKIFYMIWYVNLKNNF
jgi:hypothetical protein